MAVYIETKTKDELLARLSGEIDHHSSLWLRMDIDTAICENKPKTCDYISWNKPKKWGDIS